LKEKEEKEEKRRERDEKQLEEGSEEKEEEEEILTTPTSEKSLDIQEEQRLKEELSRSIVIREEAREYINTSILRDIEESLGRTEGETF